MRPLTKIKEKKEKKETRDLNKGDFSTSAIDTNNSNTAKNLKSLVKFLFNIEKNDRHDFVLDKKIQQLALESLKVHTDESIYASEFIGVVAKCRISGCDIHVLNYNLEVSKHYRLNESIDEHFSEARNKVLNLQDGAIGILIFSDRLEVLYESGVSEKIY